MVLARAMACCVLLVSIASARSGRAVIAIDVQPRATLHLRIRSALPGVSSALGLALGRSLGCTLSGVREESVGDDRGFHAECTGVFRRYSQLVEGDLIFDGIRTALLSHELETVEVDVSMLDAPYRANTFPDQWAWNCYNGVNHATFTGSPDDLPDRPIHVAFGYRTVNLLLLFGPQILGLLAGVAVCVWLAHAASQAVMDPYELWFSYLRNVERAAIGICALWMASWSAVVGSFGRNGDVWVLLMAWNSWTGPLVAQKAAAFLLQGLPPFLIGCVLIWRTRAVFPHMRGPQWRWRDTVRVLILPSLSWVLPALFALDALNAVPSGRLALVLTPLAMGLLSRSFLGYLSVSGRFFLAPPPPPEVAGRLKSLADRARIEVREIHLLPAGNGFLASPLALEGDTVLLSAYVMETLTPSEIEALAAREWSLPLRGIPALRLMLFLLASMSAGAGLTFLSGFGLAIPLQGIFGAQVVPILARSLFPLIVSTAMIAAWFIRGAFVHRANHRAVSLTPDSQFLNTALAKLSRTQLPPWHWHQPQLPVEASTPGAEPVLPKISAT